LNLEKRVPILWRWRGPLALGAAFLVLAGLVIALRLWEGAKNLLLTLGIVAAGGVALYLTRPGRRTSDHRDLGARMDLALRRILASFRPQPGELFYRWGLKAANPDRAVAYLEEAARLDHPEAHFELGLFYEEGGQGPGGRDLATRHYRAAADLGHLEATYRLAELLRWGIGPARDPGAAHRWYLRSAHGGFRPAMEWLVRAYEFGEGVEEDLEKAVFWTVKVQELKPVGLRISHFAPAQAPREGLHERYEPQGPAQGAEALFRQGMSFLGEDGEHRRDPIAARIWLLRAAEAGHVEAMAELANLLASGVGGIAHTAEARDWFVRAGKAGHRGAQIRLGILEVP